jgi:hypothetical protein
MDGQIPFLKEVEAMAKKTAAGALGACLVAGVTLFGIASPASAAPAVHGWPNKINVWGEANFQGYTWSWFRGKSVENVNPQIPQDSISSIANNTEYNYCLFVDTNYRGNWIVVDAGAEVPELTGELNDSLSSLRPC